jgi:hypothetical protein
MRRTLLSVCAVGLLLAVPATASAGSWRGVVVGKDARRGTVVTASANGTVRTVRAPAKARALRLGQRVAVRATKIADGTFAAAKIRVVGRTHRAHIRATVVRPQTRAGRTVVSAGSSVLALRAKARRGVASSGDGLAPGDRIDAVLDVDDDLEIDDLDEIGHSDLLELNGVLLGSDTTTLHIGVGAGMIDVTVPPGFLLPPLDQNAQVELLVSVGIDGKFTLAAVKDDNEDNDEADDDDHGIKLGNEDDEIEVKGTIVGTPGADITVQPGTGASPVTCSFASGVAPSGIGAGAFVELKCDLVDGKLVVRKVESEDDDDEMDDDEDEDHSGPGSGDDDDDHSGSGHDGDGDGDQGGTSGPGSSDDDDDEGGSGGSGGTPGGNG